MKNRISVLILLFISLSIMAKIGVFSSSKENISQSISAQYDPTDSYKTLWAGVDSLKKIGQPKSVLKIVNIIYLKAKKENNSPQFLKAVLVKLSIKSRYEENSLIKSIDELKKEVKSSSGSQKAILQSALAEQYYNYYIQNRWRINQRSTTINFHKEDMQTWSVTDLFNATIKNYQASLSHPQRLKKISLKNYSIILYEEKNSKKYRPTLYDFLAHRSLTFFRNTMAGITRPADHFSMKKNDYLATADVFMQLKIEATDSMSSDYYGIKLLQDLLKFHANDSDPTAFVDADLIRLQYVKDRISNPNKDSLYLQALINIKTKYEAYPVSSIALFEIAKHYNKQGDKFNRLSPGEHQWDKKTAMEYCQEAITKFPNSEGGNNCKSLAKIISLQDLSLWVEYANLPQRPFLSRINSKDIDDVYLRIIRINPEKYKTLKNKMTKNKFVKHLFGIKPIKQWTVNLQNQGDHQRHSMEIKMPALPLGFYVVLADKNLNYSAAKSTVIEAPLWITNISYISSKNSKNEYDFYMLDRKSGQPLLDVIASCNSNYYDYNKRRRVSEHLGDFKSDANGKIHLKNFATNNYKSINIKFKKGDDFFIPTEYFSQYVNYPQKAHVKITTHFFTDRAIYRPGQIIYFKGIMLKKTNEKVEIMANAKSLITLYDHNRTKVKELKVETNSYGSFHGSFTAPNNGITGNMSISSKTGSIYFYVEEYKRPKFEVEILPVKGSYKLGEKVSVKGKATAYAGNSIDGAKVKYRVVRTSRFPYWSYWWRWQRPLSSSMEIKNGEIETDENGEFIIDFIALNDKSLGAKYLPVFDYLVYADVTDLNGETHSTQKSVSVGARALILNINIPKRIDQSQKSDFAISTTNLNGEFIPTKGEIKIYRLIRPQQIFRPKKWARSDRFSMTEKEYHELFPNDVYDDEDKIYNWQSEPWGLNFMFDTGKDKKLDLNQILNSEAGSFKMIISAKDAFGQEVEQKYYFSTFSPSAKQISLPTTDWFQPLDSKVEPGQEARLLIGTQANNQLVLFQVESKGLIIDQKWISLNKEQKMISIPVKENYRGDFFYHIAFVKNNRVYTHKQRVKVPFTNKKLDIEFETFRNKLQPGEKEEWRIKIKGKDGDKVAAEMLATMYDASLDAFAVNHWNLSLYRSNRSFIQWTSGAFNTSEDHNYHYTYPRYTHHNYDRLNWFRDFRYVNYTSVKRSSVVELSAPMIDRDEVATEYEEDMEEGVDDKKAKNIVVGGTYNNAFKLENNKPIADSISVAMQRGNPPSPKIRTNFNETAFFLPDLHTDAQGNIIIKFTAPESLTRWKIMGLAHTKDLKIGQIQKEVITQKELMVVPNAPRFFREGDEIIFSAKVSNISEEDLEGVAKLMLFDALTMRPIDTQINKSAMEIPFSATAGKTTLVEWKLSIPEGFGAITYRITAQAGNFSDGEEMAVPVLTNRMMVTESLPLPIRGFETKKFSFDKLINSNTSSTLKNHMLTLEFTSHPAWYAVQALPYLMEFPYECSEQTFSRFYANIIAEHIVNSSPKIKAVFEKWGKSDSEALMSNLEKNQELKSLLLEETPWVLQANNESERKKRIGLLFDLNAMAKQLQTAEQKLIQNQLSDGSWPWFRGGYGSRYITQHIVTGFGHLDHLGISNIKANAKRMKMLRSAVHYLDNQIRRDYDYMMKYYAKTKDKKHISYSQIQYLYARSYFIKDFRISKKNKIAFDYYFNQAKKYWLSENKYMEGMIALALNRYGEKTIPNLIIKSLKEHSLHSEEMGMYWKTNSSWYWYEAPVETQALMIEAFDEVANDSKSVEEMKVWLLKQKQTQDWKTTKATTEACYALLLRGSNLLASDKLVEVKLGDELINENTLQPNEIEAGTGYFKKTWDAKNITPAMGNITVTKKDSGVAWGAVYWQYFEQLDKITIAKTPLTLSKKLFVERTTSSGPVLTPVTNTTKLKVGDKIKVRIELRVDRSMDYVHMKDMRASALEPTNVISRYKWQDGLGYYESTRDAATNFFFDHLRKGLYVFEYKLFVTHKGNFSNGITTIQCMYAPEFASHSEGVRIVVE